MEASRGRGGRAKRGPIATGHCEAMSESVDRCPIQRSEGEQRHTKCTRTGWPAVPLRVPRAADLPMAGTACAEGPGQRRERWGLSSESRSCTAARAVESPSPGLADATLVVPSPTLVIKGGASPPWSRRRGILRATGTVARWRALSRRRGVSAGSACRRSAAAQAASSARRRASSKGMGDPGFGHEKGRRGVGASL